MSASVIRFVSSAVGIVLGGLFVYAGLQKHLAPYVFAEAVMEYQLLPQSLTGLTVAILPWLEMVSGVALILGILPLSRLVIQSIPVGTLLRRSALLLILGQSLLFASVLLITIARGLDIDCGCGLFFQRQVGPAAIVEDGVFLLLTGLLYWRERRVQSD